MGDIEYRTTVEDPHWRDADVTAVLRAVESAESMEDLAELAERLHAAGHVLLDALEQSE